MNTKTDASPRPLPPKGAWVADLSGGGSHPQVAQVRDAYEMDGEQLLDLVMYSHTGERLGKLYGEDKGPTKGFEPCCAARYWTRIEKPSFADMADARYGWRGLLVPLATLP